VKKLLAIAVVLFLPAPLLAAPPRTPERLSYAGDRVLVVSAAAEAPGVDALRGRHPSAASVMSRYGLDRMERLGPAMTASSRRAVEVYALRSSQPGFDPLEAAAALRATGAFRAVSPDYRLSLFVVPNDPDRPQQWYVSDGNFADVRLIQAWDLEQGDPSTVIAIMDTGVDTGHPDLASKIWTNPGETPGNGIDDDLNGFIDDVSGWDFGRNDNDPNPEYFPDAIGIDVGFHGTFCAAIASAATDNAEGVSGAGWNCRIMPLKVAHPDSGITSSMVAGAFLYAIDQGADVLSMSLGGPGDPGVPEFFQALVDDANAAGVMCVAAAGNDGVNVPTYPAGANGVLAVAATDAGNARAPFSNWGPWVDIAAPGAGMWSAIARNYELSEIDQIFYIFLFGWDGVRPYMLGDGTSFACPLVAGIAGLVRTRMPALGPLEVAQHLVATGDVVAYDHPIGPRVNAFTAVGTTVSVGEPDAPQGVALAGIDPNPSSITSTIRFAIAAGGPVRLALYDASGRHVRELAGGTFTAGAHRATWDGLDATGRATPSGIYFVRLEAGGHVVQEKLVRVGR
jgi:subtilisin family serine protease